VTPLEQLLDNITLLQLIGWVAGLITFITLWVKFRWWSKLKACLAWMQRAVGLVDQLITLPADMEFVKTTIASHSESIKDIRHEVMPNGGDSLADKVNVIAAVQQELVTGQAVMKSEIRSVRRQGVALKKTTTTTATTLDEHILLSATNRAEDAEPKE
jgi:hypothetical protein